MFLVSFYIIFFTLKIFAEQKPCKKFFLFQLCAQKTAALANLCAKHQKQRLLFAARPSFGKALQVFRFRPKFDFWGGGSYAPGALREAPCPGPAFWSIFSAPWGAILRNAALNASKVKAFRQL